MEKRILIAGLFFFTKSVFEQTSVLDTAAIGDKLVDTTTISKKNIDAVKINNRNEKDLGDVFQHLFHKHSHIDSANAKIKKFNLAFIPTVGYSLQTGWAVLGGMNIAFQTSDLPNQKISSILTSVTYSQYDQTIFPFVANIWTKNNKLNFVTDIRFIEYPSAIYGLGGKIDPNQGYTIDFTGIKFHQTVQKEIAKNFYIGLGYYYDQYWDIKALDSFKRNVARRLAHKLGTSERASGIAAKLLYDSRLNQINPKQGIYANMVYRPNFTFLGSDHNWQSFLSDVRAYFPFPRRSNNTLALWSYTWLTVGPTAPPYLMLPSVGWDDNYNTGRGYIQGRFRGKDMYYFETEYRMKLSHNDIFHGVVFCNLEKYSGDLSTSYESIKPGYGLGIRLKLNKISGANVCVDYGFGNKGSRGFFVNIGEVF